MNAALELAVSQTDSLKSATVAEVRAIGIQRSKLWDTAWECLRLMGHMDDDELCDLLYCVKEKLDSRNVDTRGAIAALDDSIHEITNLPAEHSPEDDAYGRFA